MRARVPRGQNVLAPGHPWPPLRSPRVTRTDEASAATPSTAKPPTLSSAQPPAGGPGVEVADGCVGVWPVPGAGSLRVLPEGDMGRYRRGCGACSAWGQLMPSVVGMPPRDAPALSSWSLHLPGRDLRGGGAGRQDDRPWHGGDARHGAPGEPGDLRGAGQEDRLAQRQGPGPGRAEPPLDPTGSASPALFRTAAPQAPRQPGTAPGPGVPPARRTVGR